MKILGEKCHVIIIIKWARLQVKTTVFMCESLCWCSCPCRSVQSVGKCVCLLRVGDLFVSKLKDFRLG